MSKRYTLKVYPKGLGRDVYRVLEISGKDTLDDLCEDIMNAFDFVHEHLYEFNMDNRMYGSKWSYRCNPDPWFGLEDGRSTDIEIGNMNLAKGQKFSLHYDFGDDWMFVITVQGISDEARRTSSKVIKSKGGVKQYPDWDDDDEEI
ncbi:MAG: hypothetical protein Q4C82_00230 [Eubacteriales bacterium]|nr:hypothetical protein [Eubacteriales bacterium]